MRRARRLVRGGRLEAARASLAALLLVGAGGGCAPDTGRDAQLPTPEPATRSEPATPSEPATRSGSDLADADVWLSFERTIVDYDGLTAYPDALGGPFAGRVVTANGGRVEQVSGADGRGSAVAFPAKCAEPSGCPSAMVEILPRPALNPGERDFEYGASVWLSPDQTTTGSNIVQKGRFGSPGGQWKLQVDSLAGEPSCVLRSGADQLIARSRVSIADSAWHDVVCRRDREGLSIRVDDTVDRVDGRTGSVSNQWPVRVGGPGVGDDDDHFHGRVDNVFLRIDPSA